MRKLILVLFVSLVGICMGQKSLAADKKIEDKIIKQDTMKINSISFLKIDSIRSFNINTSHFEFYSDNDTSNKLSCFPTLTISDEHFQCLGKALINLKRDLLIDSVDKNYVEVYISQNSTIHKYKIKNESWTNELYDYLRECLSDAEVQTIMKYIDPENRYHQE